MSVAAAQGAQVAPVERKEWSWFQTTLTMVLVIAITGWSIGYIESKSHRPTPIRTAFAKLIDWIPWLAPVFFFAEKPIDPGPPMMQGECDCEVGSDGSATAKVDGQEVPALNHEFGG